MVKTAPCSSPGKMRKGAGMMTLKSMFEFEFGIWLVEMWKLQKCTSAKGFLVV